VDGVEHAAADEEGEGGGGDTCRARHRGFIASLGSRKEHPVSRCATPAKETAVLAAWGAKQSEGLRRDLLKRQANDAGGGGKEEEKEERRPSTAPVRASGREEGKSDERSHGLMERGLPLTLSSPLSFSCFFPSPFTNPPPLPSPRFPHTCPPLSRASPMRCSAC
jgi:hypothetical protein